MRRAAVLAGGGGFGRGPFDSELEGGAPPPGTGKVHRMTTDAATQPQQAEPTKNYLLDEQSAEHLLKVITIGGLALGTFGTFHAVTTLVFGAAPGNRGFVSARLEAVHHFALVTIVASQVLQLIGSAALWRRRLLGRTLLLTYATVYLAALILVESMRSIDEVS